MFYVHEQNEVLMGLHRQYLSDGPCLVLCLQRENAVKKLLDLIGPADPRAAKKQSPFMWRGMFGADPVANGLYCKSRLRALQHMIQPFFEQFICKNTLILSKDTTFKTI